MHVKGWQAIRRRKKERRRRAARFARALIRKRGTRYGSTTVVINKSGPPCPRCSQATQVRAHNGLTEKQKRQPFYFERWYCCLNSDCKTTLIMPDEHKVWNDQGDIALTILNSTASPLRGTGCAAKGEVPQ